MCAYTSLGQDGFYPGGLWVVSITWHHSPYDLQGVFLHMCSRRGLLTSRMRNMGSLVFCLGRARPPPPIILLFSSWNISPQKLNSNCLPWDPSISCPSAAASSIQSLMGPQSGASAVSWLVVYRRAGAEGDVGWEVRRSAPWKASFLTTGDLPHICTSHTLLSSSSEGAGRRTAVPSAHSADRDTEAHGVTGLRCCDDPVKQAGGTFSI